eukprot:35598-Eustigmatos_ZCMA.PRE.1
MQQQVPHNLSELIKSRGIHPRHLAPLLIQLVQEHIPPLGILPRKDPVIEPPPLLRRAKNGIQAVPTGLRRSRQPIPIEAVYPLGWRRR